MELWIIWAVAGLLLGTLVWGLSNLRHAYKTLAFEKETINSLKAFRAQVHDNREFAVQLPAKCGTVRLAGKYAKEIFSVANAGSQIDQASIRERAVRELEDQASLARTISNLAVYGGLLGTLMGLAVAALRLTTMSGKSSASDFMEQAGTMFSHLGWAFFAAGVGIVVTLVLGWLVAAYDKQASEVAVSIESICVETIMPVAQALSRPVSTEQVLSRLIEDFRTASSENLERLSETANALKSAASALKKVLDGLDSLSVTLDETSRRVGDSIQSSRDSTLALGTASEQLARSGAIVAQATLDFKDEVSKFDSTALQEANRRMGEVVPSLGTELSQIAAHHTKATQEAMGQILSAVNEQKAILSGNAQLISDLDGIARELLPLAAAGDSSVEDLAASIVAALNGQQPRSQAATVISPASADPELVDLLRQIKAELQVQRQVSPTQVVDGGATVIQPIPPQVVTNLEYMVSLLRSIESNISRPVRTFEASTSPRPSRQSIEEPWFKRIFKRRSS